jgi:hypothetical protein
MLGRRILCGPGPGALVGRGVQCAGGGERILANRAQSAHTRTWFAIRTSTWEPAAPLGTVPFLSMRGATPCDRGGLRTRSKQDRGKDLGHQGWVPCRTPIPRRCTSDTPPHTSRTPATNLCKKLVQTKHDVEDGHKGGAVVPGVHKVLVEHHSGPKLCNISWVGVTPPAAQPGCSPSWRTCSPRSPWAGH